MKELYPGQKFVHEHSKVVRETELRWQAKQGVKMYKTRLIALTALLFAAGMLIGLMYQQDVIDQQRKTIKLLYETGCGQTTKSPTTNGYQGS